MTEDRGSDAAWRELELDHYERWWRLFEACFGFHADTQPAGWPAIAEPSPSVTFDLSRIDDGPRRAAAVEAINAEALLAFVWALPDVTELVVLDWQHPVHLFEPATQALVTNPTWEIPVYPDGEYYAFCTPDFAEGTFGHPWERTLCVMGPRLTASLGRTLATWLPVSRIDGRAHKPSLTGRH